MNKPLDAQISSDAKKASREWHREMGRYIKDIDPWDHLITTHFSNDYRRVDPNIASLRELDYVVSDAYRALVEAVREQETRHASRSYQALAGAVPRTLLP